jgi:hypothetical protein
MTDTIHCDACYSELDPDETVECERCIATVCRNCYPEHCKEHQSF